MIHVLRSSAHAHPQWRTCGGGRRSAQIEEILRGHGIVWQDTFSSPRPTRRALLATILRLRLTAPVIRMRPRRSLLRYLADDYLRHRWFFAHHPEVRVFVVEECTDYARLRAARAAGVGIISLPHNLETWQQSPARDFYSGEGPPAAIHREAIFSALSDVVFCISREEQWFLTNHGAVTDYLPYHPPAAERTRLGRIRARRQVRSPEPGQLLAVASGRNTRNRAGLQALARQIALLPEESRVHLHLGGQALGDLPEQLRSPRCTFHGELNEEQLETLMVRCHAAVVYQESGVGALTRIPEMLCAGLPVLANAHAARSAYHLPGVTIFHDLNELTRLATQYLHLPPVPVPDQAAEARLVSWVTRLAARRPRLD